ncbi:MAG: translation initiation factor eIF-2B [Candidatus Kariarchaeaceae archaeon]
MITMELLRDISQRISDLTIQGATNVAIEGVKAFSEYATRLFVEERNIFLQELEIAKSILWNARPTEPALKNGLRYILSNLRKKEGSVDELKELASEKGSLYLDLLKSSKRQIIEFGSTRIDDNTTVMTHCHSSLASGTIVEAFKQGKNITAVCTETRPLYQGRKTAIELVSAGVPTTMVVDSGMRWAIRKFNADIIIIGADAITSQGTVFNKIGSRLLALAAKESDVPVYVTASLLKFDAQTHLGERTEIEMRGGRELWPDAPEGLNIVNPAFETISRDYIDGLITEAGIFPPEIVYQIVQQTYPFALED